MKCQRLGEGLAVVRFDSLPGGGELSAVHERPALVVEAPKLAGDKSAVSGKEARRSCRVILVEGFAFGIGCGVTCGADVMQYEIGVSVAHEIRAFHGCIVWNHAGWNGERSLEKGNRSQVGRRELVRKPVSIGVSIEPEALFRLHAVVVVEGIVAELPYRNHIADLMQRPDDQARRSCALVGQTGRR